MDMDINILVEEAFKEGMKRVKDDFKHPDKNSTETARAFRELMEGAGLIVYL